MAQLEYNKPFETRTSTLQIDGLKAGVYRFQLQVIDDAGNVSNPDIAKVRVQWGLRSIPTIFSSIGRKNLV